MEKPDWKVAVIIFLLAALILSLYSVQKGPTSPVAVHLSKPNSINAKDKTKSSQSVIEEPNPSPAEISVLGRNYGSSLVYNRTAMLPLVWEHLTSSWDPSLCLGGSGPLTPLPGYRAPCWTEKINQTILESSYKDNHFANSTIYRPDMKKSKRMRIKSTLSIMASLYKRGLQKMGDQPFRIRCLPSVYIIGVNKGGTTDLYHSVAKHPMIVGPTWKENRFPKPGNLDYIRFIDYLEIYDKTSLELGQNPKHVTIDGNIAYHKSYFNFTGNDSFLNSVFYIRSINPDAPLVMIMRDPVARIRSLYYFHYKNHGGEEPPSAARLHNLTVNNINAWKMCMAKYESIRYCVINTHETIMTSFPRNFYYVYVKDILSLIPREKIIFIHAESYYKDRTPVLAEIFQKMGLPPLPDTYMEVIAQSKASNKGPRDNDGMLPETEALIREFFKPYHKLLAELLQDDRFLWKQESP